MKKFITVVFIIILSLQVKAQVDLMGGMGISFQSTPSLNDYLNNIATGSDKLSDFTSAVTFSFEADYAINPAFDMGIEYEAKIYSYNTSFSGLGNYDFSYLAHSPSVLGYYVLQGPGYKFKFGGGVGCWVISIEEKLPIETINYTATGFGLLLKAQAHTLLGGDFYAFIGGDVRYDIIGEAKNGNLVLGSDTNFNTLSVGVKLGVSYFIR